MTHSRSTSHANVKPLALVDENKKHESMQYTEDHSVSK